MTAWRATGIVLLASLSAGMLAGCITLPKQMPAEYFTPRRTLAIEITQCAAAPTLSSGSAGQTKLADLAFLARQQAMKNRLAGFTPQRIEAVVQEKLAAQLAQAFVVTNAPAELLLEVQISSWGWSVPTDEKGFRKDTHNFDIWCDARILDPAKNRQKVYGGVAEGEAPIGDKPTVEKCEEAFPLAAEALAKQLTRFILKGRPDAVTYRSPDGRTFRVVYDHAADAVRLVLSDEPGVVLPRVASAAGLTYSDGKTTLKLQDGEASVEAGGETILSQGKPVKTP